MAARYAMTPVRIGVLAIVAAAIALFFIFDLGQYFDLDFLKAQQSDLARVIAAQPLLAGLAYFAIYVVVTGLSLPGAAVMTLIGGALFGLLWGTVIVSFASTAGAAVAFLFSRYLFKQLVEERFQRAITAIDRGIERDGAFYLFTLRLIPIFPFFAINLVMGVTSIKTRTFILVSQLGMLPATLVFVNAGTQLAQITTAADVLSPQVLGAFVLLGVFPLATKRIVQYVQRRRVGARFARPKHYDHNLIVIGAGSGGLVAAYMAAALKAKVMLIEEDRMGGDCLNTGCVPSKALIRTARLAHEAGHAGLFGLDNMAPVVDFAAVMQRIARVISTIEPHDSPERYATLGVECLKGHATLVSPYAVTVDGREITARNIVIATGARPFVPPIPGIESVHHVTSDTVWDLRALPRRLVVLGGGPIGCELSQAFARLGSTVTLVEMASRLLLREDEEISALLGNVFAAEHIDLRLGHRAVECRGNDAGQILVCEDAAGARVEIAFDTILVAVGRRANTDGLGLENLGIATRGDGTVETNDFLQTRFPNIYACGDVAGPFQFTHTASHQAWYAAVNSLFGALWRFRADYSVIPWCTFTDPEIARVGMNEQEASSDGVSYETTHYDLADLDRAITDETAHGRVKILTVPGTDTLLGVTIIGPRAGDIIAEFTLAMKHGLGLKKILATTHIYPTYAEANKAAAGNWQRDHAPQAVLRWVERFHTWRRGR